MIVLLVLAGVVVLLALVAVLADQTVARLAERRATEVVATRLGTAVRVQVHEEPFLAQAVKGRYRDVEVEAGPMQLGTIAGATLHAHLVNVLLPLRFLLVRQVAELPIEQVHGSAVLPWAELARFSPVPGLRLRFRDGRLLASAALPVPGLGQLAQVSGHAVAGIADGGVWLRVRNVSVAGISVPPVVLNQLVPRLTFPIPLPPLPYGIRIEQLTPTPHGLQVTGSARAVVLRAG